MRPDAGVRRRSKARAIRVRAPICPHPLLWRWRGIASLVVAAIASAMLVACGVKFDSHSSKDATRAGAVAIKLGVAVDDRVSAPAGDNTDWKTFTVSQPQAVAVDIWWDNADVAGSLTVRNAFGAKIASASHQAGQSKDTLGPIQVKAGTYYLQIVARKGSSVYTLEVRDAQSGPPDRPGF